MASNLILGEFRRTLDERFRLSIPGELLPLLNADGRCLLAKERPGALSLWPLEPWRERLDAGVSLLAEKLAAGRLNQRLPQVQKLGRLLSTRQRSVTLAGRGRLLVPEGFREFLGAAPGSDLLVVGAAVCLEIWRPDAWLQQLAEEIPHFRQLYDELTA